MTKSAPRKVAARKARSASKSNAIAKARGRNRRTPQKVASKLRNNIAAETVRESRQLIEAQLNRVSQVPDTLRGLAERNVAQARELYEGSKNTLQAVLESWQKSFGAAGQGAAALNRRLTDLAERNINTGFDLATDLAGARNLAEVMELQAAYWRRLLGELQAHQGGRARSSKGRVSSRNR